MNIVSFIIISLCAVNILIVIIAGIFWKPKTVTFTEIFLAGSFIYRDLHKYIKADRIKAFLAMSYSAVILFLLFIVSIFFCKP